MQDFGTYTLSHFENGCTSVQSFYLLNSTITRLKEKCLPDLEIMYNSNRDVVLKSVNTIGSEKIKVFNVEGKIINEFTIDDPYIVLTGLNPGVYIVEVQKERTVVLRKKFSL